MATPKRSLDLVQQVLDGRTGSISRLISRAEAGDPECRPAMAEIYRHTGRARVVGITGVPGSGKSTLVRELALAGRQAGNRIGVIAIDPSSPYSGGSILGDRIRMNELTADEGIFIRSMATRGMLGGLARPALDAVDLLDAAGFDLILLETVGAGQDSVDVSRATHTVVVVSAPGLGDDIQAIKAGILEIADIHVVSKCDRSDAGKTVADLQGMMHLDSETVTGKDWRPPLVRTAAEVGEGIDDMLSAIMRHGEYLESSGEIVIRRQRTAEMRMLKFVEDVLRGRLLGGDDQLVAELVQRVLAREIDPHTASLRLIAALSESETT